MRQSAVLPDGRILLNWDTQNQRFVQDRHGCAVRTPEEVAQAISRKRPKEIEDFVSALTELYAATGFSGGCSRCFQRKPESEGESHWTYRRDSRPRPEVNNHIGRGCCGTCEFLSETGCLAKPIRCAYWLCGAGDDYPLLRKIFSKSWKLGYVHDGRPYSQGYIQETEEGYWSEEDLVGARRRARYYRWCARRIRAAAQPKVEVLNVLNSTVGWC